MQAVTQLRFLAYEYSRLVNRKPWRYITTLMTASFWVIAHYRLERSFYLLFGRSYIVARLFLLPIFFLTSPLRSNCEVHYRADLGRGFRVLHPGLGVVVSSETVAGHQLILVGGNCIGRKSNIGHVVLGDNVTLGANAVIIGPITVGDNVSVGASSLLITDAASNTTWGGVPAKPLKSATETIMPPLD